LEAEFVTWTEEIPDLWRYYTAMKISEIQGDITKMHAFPGDVDIYHDIWMASIWNLSRASRLFIQGVVIRCAAWLSAPNDYITTEEYASAATLGQRLVNEVCASVPYHLGWPPAKAALDLVNFPDISGFACGDDSESSAKNLGGYFLLWPLFVAGSLDFVPDIQRQWIRGRLAYIGHSMGIKQAEILSQVSGSAFLNVFLCTCMLIVRFKFDLRLPSSVIQRFGAGSLAHNALKVSDERVAMEKLRLSSTSPGSVVTA
jgi:hypothetical protein